MTSKNLKIYKRRGTPRLQEEAASSSLDDTSWEMEGSGVGSSDGDKLMNQLYVSLGLIRDGNT